MRQILSKLLGITYLQQLGIGLPSLHRNPVPTSGPKRQSRETRRSLTVRNLRGSIPGNGYSAKHKFRSPCSLWKLPDSRYGRTPNHASQSAKNTEHEMCDAGQVGKPRRRAWGGKRNFSLMHLVTRVHWKNNRSYSHE